LPESPTPRTGAMIRRGDFITLRSLSTHVSRTISRRADTIIAERHTCALLKDAFSLSHHYAL
jgi:hypothetical protein